MLALLTAAAVESPWYWTVLALLSVPALVALNAFFVAAEFSLVAVRRTRVEEMVNQGVTGARAVASAIENLDRYIAATQLGITLASIGLGWIGEPALARLIDPMFKALPEAWAAFATHSVAVVIAFSLITFMHVVFGELIPKTMSLQQPDKLALLVATPLLIFAKLTRPLIVVMNGTGNWLVRRLGFEPASEVEMVHSVGELAMIIEDTEEAGILASDQAEFVQNVFQLSNKTVRDCMVPREKMAGLELNTPPEKVLDEVRQGAHTRMPVYERELDNIVGIVNTKDLFYLFSLKGMVILQDALYPALFLKPEIEVSEALKLFRKAHRPMALVRDDDNKILGLITLEDIVEEIVGDIEDEHDRPTPKLKIVRMKQTLKLPAQKLSNTATNTIKKLRE